MLKIKNLIVTNKINILNILIVATIIVNIFVIFDLERKAKPVTAVLSKNPEAIALAINSKIDNTKKGDRSKCPDGFKITTNGKLYSYTFNGRQVAYKFDTIEKAIADAWFMWDVDNDKTHWEIVE